MRKNNQNLFKFIGVFIALISNQTVLAKLPPSNTNLYQKVAHDCKNVDLTNWQHPARDILIKNHIKIQKVQLCNNNRYPIFIGESEYDLSSQPNQRFANRFFIALAEKNSKWSYAFVDTINQHINYVEVNTKPFSITTRLETYP